MKKGIVIISLILLGITAFRIWRIHDTRSLSGTGKVSVEVFSPILPVNKWEGVPPVPASNAVFGIVPEKETGKKKKSARKKAGKKKRSKSKNAGKAKLLPRVFGVFSEQGNRYALIERKFEKAGKKKKSGGLSNKQSRPGYLALPEGGAVGSYLLSEILSTRVLFKAEGGEEHLVKLFQYDQKFIKGEENVTDMRAHETR